MNGVPEADYFTDIVVMPHEDDIAFWKVVGIKNDGSVIKSTNIVDYVPNKPLAEAALRWYCEGYWKKMFQGLD